MKIKECRILILKDEQVGNTTKKMLAQMGFKKDNIFLAGNVKEAKDIFISKGFNMVLAGIGVNENMGHILLEWFQAMYAKPLVYFIFYSGAGKHYIKQKTEEYGADGYVSLPVNMATLESTLRDILSKK